MSLWCYAVLGLVLFEKVYLSDLDKNQTLTLKKNETNLEVTIQQTEINSVDTEKLQNETTALSELADTNTNATKTALDLTDSTTETTVGTKTKLDINSIVTSETTTVSDFIDITTGELKDTSDIADGDSRESKLVSAVIATPKNETITTDATNTSYEYYVPTTEITIFSLKGNLVQRSMKKENVVTCDGYILNIFRLKPKKGKPIQKYPVLLFHGMMQSSDIFVEIKKSSVDFDDFLAFILEDLGFDVWLGNSRGNKYSRLHIDLELDLWFGEKKKFFNYSYEEIGLHDVGAIVDFILNETGAEQLHYIGVAQGGTAFLVLNSLQPHYNDKFKTAHLLAPLGYQNHYKNAKIQALAKVSAIVYKALVRANILEIFQYNSTPRVPFTSHENCLGREKYENICVDLGIDEIMGLNQTNYSNFDTIGGSLKQLAHFGQNILQKSFRRFDYGIEKNRLGYGADIPPEYDLSLVSVKTFLYYSLNDDFVDEKDVIEMATIMPNARAEQVARTSFTHHDFVKGRDLVSAVYKTIIYEMGAGEDFERTYENVEEDKHKPDSSTKLSLSLTLYALPLLLTLKCT